MSTETMAVEATESTEMLEFEFELVSEKAALEIPMADAYCSCECW